MESYIHVNDLKCVYGFEYSCVCVFLQFIQIHLKIFRKISTKASKILKSDVTHWLIQPNRIYPQTDIDTSHIYICTLTQSYEHLPRKFFVAITHECLVLYLLQQNQPILYPRVGSLCNVLEEIIPKVGSNFTSSLVQVT